jgi:HSP20 family protein
MSGSSRDFLRTVPSLWRRGEFDAFDRALNSFLEGFGALETQSAAFSPRLDVRETPSELRVTVELPGVDEKDVKVEYHDNVLTIRGEKKSEFEEKDSATHRVERSYGSFMRQLSIPSFVDAEKVSATFKNGLLTVAMAKRSADSGKRTIDIKTS